MLIMVEQLPAMFGLIIHERIEESTFKTMLRYFSLIKNCHLPTTILGFTSLVFLILHKFWIKRVKNPYLKKTPVILILVIISITLSASINFQGVGIKILGDFNNQLLAPSAPEITFERLVRMIPDALMITIVGFIESQTVTRTFGLKNDYFPESNRELFALGSLNFSLYIVGAANIFGSFFACYPTFGSLPRSRILYNSGGQTVLAGGIAGVFVFILIMSLKTLLKFLPLSVLGAVVFMAAINLIEYSEIFYLLQMKVNNVIK